MRVLAFVVGAALLAATAHATVMAVGGYGSAHSFITLAIAAGVAVASVVIGSRWVSRRLTTWLLLAIVAGEMFGLIMTAERLVAGRDAAQAPMQQATLAYANAARRVTDAAGKAREVPTTSPRLDTALLAKRDADKAVLDKSDAKSCLANCRVLLQQAADNAQAEVNAARSELSVAADLVKRELAAAAAAFSLAKAPASATPLADRVGLPGWAIDLLVAVLGSVGANGLGCGLMAFAGHSPAALVTRVRHRRRVWRRKAITIAAPPAQNHPTRRINSGTSLVVRFPAPPKSSPATERKPNGFPRVGRLVVFLADALEKEIGDRVDVQAIRAQYVAWCSANGFMAMTEDAFALEFANVCKKLNLRCTPAEATIYIMDVRLVA